MISYYKHLRRFSTGVSFDAIKKTKALNFNLTSDLYRVDIGLLLSRCPIYYNISKEQLEHEKYNYNFYKQSKTPFDVNPELLKFDIKDPLVQQRGKRDETISHLKKDKDGNEIYYRENSK